MICLSSANGTQPISLKLLKGLGCCPGRKTQFFASRGLDALLAKYESELGKQGEWASKTVKHRFLTAAHLRLMGQTPHKLLFQNRLRTILVLNKPMSTSERAVYVCI